VWRVSETRKKFCLSRTCFCDGVKQFTTWHCWQFDPQSEMALMLLVWPISMDVAHCSVSRTIVTPGWRYIMTVFPVLCHKFYSRVSQSRYSVPMAPTGCTDTFVTVRIWAILQGLEIFPSRVPLIYYTGQVFYTSTVLCPLHMMKFCVPRLKMEKTTFKFGR